ncbi:FBP domain-containing protein [Streptomyces sp. NPDC002516]
MRPLTEQDIRTSFVNCSRGEAKRLATPRDLDDRPWGDLDFLGWRDPGAPDRSYLVSEQDGGLMGVALRLPPSRRGLRHRSMCSLCLTTHPGDGVSLMTARKAGAAGREGNSVGVYICADLDCSLYVRGRKPLRAGSRFEETLTTQEQIARTVDRLSSFLAKLRDGTATTAP